ncbi:MAG: IS1595 family transposase, partial [Acidobacteria bacterium]
DGGPLWGDKPVEIDEAYVGGKQRHMGTGRPGSGSNKTAVLGIVQRQGRVFAAPVRSVQRATLMEHIEERVLPATTVYTDEYRSYDRLSWKGYVHHRIRHAERVYVSGDVHTNTIEGFWSLVKRGIGGVYHSVSRKHLQGYLNEYAWRYNMRHEARGRFQLLLLRATL